jgi:hypothetical protein
LSESLKGRNVIGLCRRILLKNILRKQGMIYVTEDRDNWHAFVKTVMTLQVL